MFLPTWVTSANQRANKERTDFNKNRILHSQVSFKLRGDTKLHSHNMSMKYHTFDIDTFIPLFWILLELQWSEVVKCIENCEIGQNGLKIERKMAVTREIFKIKV